MGIGILIALMAYFRNGQKSIQGEFESYKPFHATQSALLPLVVVMDGFVSV